jgi:hypothetical protein
LKYSSGNVYSGQWEDGKANGYGIYTQADGEIGINVNITDVMEGTHSEGEWKDGRLNGRGFRIEK